MVTARQARERKRTRGRAHTQRLRHRPVRRRKWRLTICPRARAQSPVTSNMCLTQRRVETASARAPRRSNHPGLSGRCSFPAVERTLATVFCSPHGLHGTPFGSSSTPSTASCSARQERKQQHRSLGRFSDAWFQAAAKQLTLRLVRCFGRCLAPDASVLPSGACRASGCTTRSTSRDWPPFREAECAGVGAGAGHCLLLAEWPTCPFVATC